MIKVWDGITFISANGINRLDSITLMNKKGNISREGFVTRERERDVNHVRKI